VRRREAGFRPVLAGAEGGHVCRNSF